MKKILENYNFNKPEEVYELIYHIYRDGKLAPCKKHFTALKRDQRKQAFQYFLETRRWTVYSAEFSFFFKLI